MTQATNQTIPDELTILFDEIHQQPERLNTIQQWWHTNPLDKQLVNQLSTFTHILGLGEGSSLHALQIAQPWLTELTGCPCRINTAYQGGLLAKTLEKQEKTPITPLVIIVSQSGETASLINTLGQLPEHWPVLLITNNPKSTLAKHPQTQGVIPIQAGQEHSIAATKTLSSTIANLIGLGIFWETVKYNPAHPSADIQLTAFTKGITDGLSNHNIDLFEQWGASFIKANQGPIICLTSEAWLPTVREIRLKWMETLGFSVLADSFEGFLHGPRAMCQPNYANHPHPHILCWLNNREHLPKQLINTFSKGNITVHYLSFNQSGQGAISTNYQTALPENNNQSDGLYTPYWSGLCLASGQLLAAYFCKALNQSPNHPLLTKAVVSE